VEVVNIPTILVIVRSSIVVLVLAFEVRFQNWQVFGNCCFSGSWVRLFTWLETFEGMKALQFFQVVSCMIKCYSWTIHKSGCQCDCV
jgi:hypothetical protein